MSSILPNVAKKLSPAPEQPVPVFGHDEDLRVSALAVVLVAFAVGLVLVWLHHWRRGSMMMGGAMVLAAGLRMLLPERVVGLLVVRSRLFDVLVSLTAGVAMIVLGLVVPGGFWG
ncbi:hypothetical protein HMPREF1531_01688 [Propionibacterium sp. oral taxon 192 str. F0372]|nr:hypothetical protein HMPREF1531_01688 [Propionibacterium sp. oral taxon 192 str. F0372]